MFEFLERLDIEFFLGVIGAGNRSRSNVRDNSNTLLRSCKKNLR